MARNKNWFRFYDRMIDSPEILELNDTEFRLIVSLWCIASAEGQEGKLSLTDTSINKRVMLGCTLEALQTMIEHLKRLDLVNGESGNYSIPRWMIHQYEYQSRIPKNRTDMKNKSNDKEQNGSNNETNKQNTENKDKVNGKNTDSKQEANCKVETDTDTEADTDSDSDIRCCSCSREDYIKRVINYYCTKAGILETNIKPKDIVAVETLVNDKIPINLAIQGIDNAFKNYKPQFNGDKINSITYCIPIIKGLYEKSKAKEVDNGAETGGDTQSKSGEMSEEARKFYSRGLD